GVLDTLRLGRGENDQLRTELAQLAVAAKQVSMIGDEAVTTAAVAAVKEARQAIYRLLAEV
ncbi:MAG: hypothetical protein QM655_17100, partial [Nocardioidaceae bacterium]